MSDIWAMLAMAAGVLWIGLVVLLTKIAYHHGGVEGAAAMFAALFIIHAAGAVWAKRKWGDA